MKYLILLMFIVSCSTTTPSQPELGPWTMIKTPTDRAIFVGRWYGQMIVDNVVTFDSIIDRKDNGEFTITHRSRLPKDQFKIEDFKGYWGAAGHFYFTTAKQKLVKGKYVALPKENSPFDKIYSIDSVSSDLIQLYDDMTVYTWQSKRVDKDFKLPKL